MVCDFRVATADAALGLPEIHVGLVTGIQGELLIRLVGLQAAKELVYTGDPVSGAEAAELGLVNWARRPTSMRPPSTTTSTRWPQRARTSSASRSASSGRGTRPASNGVIDHSLESIAACFDTHDQQEATGAFLKDREPTFEGR